MFILQGSGPSGSGPTGPGSGYSVMPDATNRLSFMHLLSNRALQKAILRTKSVPALQIIIDYSIIPPTDMFC